MPIPDHLEEAKEAVTFFMYGEDGDTPRTDEIDTIDFLLYAAANALIAIAERLPE